jgi:hypothetical protein
VGIEGYVAIVRYDDGRPPDRYLMGEAADVSSFYEQRRAEGKLDPVGAAWGSGIEIWALAPTLCFLYFPVFSDGLANLAQYLDCAERGLTLSYWYGQGVIDPDCVGPGNRPRTEGGGG